MRARGYRIAVDDFGAQASRLQRVAALAPDIVKFDGALVKRLMATEAGVRAAMLAATGYSGPVELFEGKEGVFEVLSNVRFDPAKMLDGLGEAREDADPELLPREPALLPGGSAGIRFCPRPPFHSPPR